MSVELTMLFYSAVLGLVQIGVPAGLALTANGVPWGISNRETPPKSSDMHGRALRARDNMLENLLIFVALTAILNKAGISTEYTILGAQLFFWGRLAHAISYVAGILYVRTLAWAASVFGMILIGWEIYQASAM